MTPKGRLAASFAALVFAACAVASGIDRMAIADPGLSRLVPDFARAHASRSEASAALFRGDASQATRSARAAIDADPVDPRNVSLLGAARLAAGDNRSAAQAFAVADRMGLRAPLVQAYFFDMALAKGNTREAARRIDILLRAYPALLSEGYFFAALEQSEAGRKELAARLKREPLWSEAYLSAKWASDEVLVARARFLASGEAGVALGCDRIEPMMRALAERNLRGEAQALAEVQCPERAAASAIADSGFERFGGDEAFGWRKHASGDVRLVAVGDRNRVIEMENRSGVTRLALSQSVALAPGEFRVFASVDSLRPDALVVSLDCGAPVRPTRGSGELARGQLIEAPNCPDQVLGIWLRPNSGVTRLDDLRIERVGLQPDPAPSISAE